MKPLAVLCRFYDEIDFLPIWLRHYGRQVGPENCYLLDHDSDDGSQHLTGRANVVRLPRSAQSDYEHLAVVRLFATELLKRYRFVLHMDADEMAVADPARYPTLTDYAVACSYEAVTLIGFNVQHVMDHEPPLDPAGNILAQRRHAWFISAMCKPALTRGPLDWSPGFHCMPRPMPFDDLYLFHLRHVDRDLGLRRLRRSREQPWSDPRQAPHQRMSDENWLAGMATFAAKPPLDEAEFGMATPELRELLGRVEASRVGREDADYRIDLGIHGEHLLRIPDRFATVF